VLARVFEATNLSTVHISLVKEHTQKVRPPRALFCGFPYGLALGKPNDADFQHRVLAATFALLDREAGPVLEEFPEDIVPSSVAATAQAGTSAERPTDPAFELTGLRGYYTQFVERYGRTAVGVSGVPQTRFRGLVRVLEQYVADGTLDGLEHPQDVTALQYLRYVCDDFKAFYREAYLAQYPDADGPRVEAWFWYETAVGDLIRRVRDRVKSSDDPYAQAIAFGISRV
jgi:hypothetical protein